MANEIRNAFNTVYVDGPAETPYEPPKSDIRDIVGGTIQKSIDDLTGLITSNTQWKTPVTLATTTNITLSGEQTVDGTLTSSTDVLVKDHATGGLKGIYTSGAGAWTRRADANDASELVGMAVFVRSGTVNGGKQFACTTPAPIVVGTTALTFAEISDQSALNANVAGKADQTEVDEINARPLPSDIFHPEFAAITAADYAGNIHGGVRHDGSLHPFEAPGNRRWVAYVEGTSPTRKIMVERDDGQVFEIAGGFEGDAYNPAITGTKCRYLINRGGVVEIQFQDLDPTTTLSSSVTTLNHAVFYGQSLSNGAYSGTFLNTLPILPGKAVMFKAGGIRSMDLSHAPIYVERRQDVALRDHLADAVERSQGDYGETGWARFAAACYTGSNALGNTDGLLVSTHGIGGASYARLKKGTPPYINLLVSVRRAYNIARMLGLTYRIPAVRWVHGESAVNSGATAAEYQAWLEELQNDLDTDIKAITGLTEDVKLIIDQLASWTVYGVAATADVALGQLAAAVANPSKIICVGLKQVFDYAVDGIHMLSLGYCRQAEMTALYWRAARAGIFLSPLMATAASRSGTTITITTTGGTGNLAVDTAQTPLRTNGGFVLSQTGGTPTAIASFGTSGGNILLELTVDPGGGDFTVSGGNFGTAGAKPGTAGSPGTNIRDSLNLASAHGAAQQRWLSTFKDLPVT